MSNSFYNTINLSGQSVEFADAKALSQELLVKQIFETTPYIKHSPSQIMKLSELLFGRRAPITSWRRAMTNLSSIKHGFFLYKTNEMVEGLFGYDEHLWKKNTLINLEQAKLF